MRKKNTNTTVKKNTVDKPRRCSTSSKNNNSCRGVLQLLSGRASFVVIVAVAFLTYSARGKATAVGQEKTEREVYWLKDMAKATTP